MSELDQLFTLIKKQLRSRGFTYKTLADKLQLSEASIKRLFRQNDVSLSRLQEICEVLNLSLSELFEQMDKGKKLVVRLTESQEKELIADVRLLLVATCILNHWAFADILNFYTLNEHELIRYAVQLDKMKIIELQPGNRFKRLIAPDFHWIPDGPIQRFFQENVQNDFFKSNFDQLSEIYLVKSGMLSEQDNQLFQKQLLKVANEFIHRCRDSQEIPIAERQGTALIIAMRPWVPAIFDQFKKS